MIILKVFFRFKAEGIEYIPKKGGFILAGNHVSYLDPIVLGVACPRRLNFMARHDLFSSPLFSQVLSAVGAFPVKRNSADKSALKEAMKRVGEGEALLVFPEGSRRVDAGAIEPQAGVGFLAAKLQVPVIPAFVSGTEKVLPRGDKFIKLNAVSVCFGKQISVERRMPYQDIAQRIMESIRHLAS